MGADFVESELDFGDATEVAWGFVSLVLSIILEVLGGVLFGREVLEAAHAEIPK